MSYYRIQSTDRPDILDPDNQTSSSWNNLGDDDRIRQGVSVCDSREHLAQTGIPFDGTWELWRSLVTPPPTRTRTRTSVLDSSPRPPSSPASWSATALT